MVDHHFPQVVTNCSDYSSVTIEVYSIPYYHNDSVVASSCAVHYNMVVIDCLPFIPLPYESVSFLGYPCIR